MIKEQYLKKLRTILEERGVLKEDIMSVLADYDELYSAGLEKGRTEEEVVRQIGSPETVYQQLKHDLRYKNNSLQKLVAISPFVSTIIFMVLGLAFDLWSQAWMAYLLIPITAILVNQRGKQKYVALSPFLTVITFLIVGFNFNLWHPGWLVFLLIPIIAIVVNENKSMFVLNLSIFLSVIASVLWTYRIPNMWKYAWLLFLMVPIIGYMYRKKWSEKMLGIASILVAVLIYIIMINRPEFARYAFLALIIPIAYAMMIGTIQMEFLGKKVKYKAVYFALLLLVLITYLVVSLTTRFWGVTWIILLAIPCLMIHAGQGFQHWVPYVPFVVTMIFVGVGYFYGYWEYLWMLYLLIPMIAILENKEKTVVIEKNNEK